MHRVRKLLRSWLVDFVVGFATMSAAVLLRWLLDPRLGSSRPFITLFGAVALAVWLRGYRAALIVAVGGYLACDYYFIAPRGSFLENTRSYAALLIFLLFSSVIIGVGEGIGSIRRHLNAARERLRDSHEFHEAIASLTADFAMAGEINADGEVTIKTITSGLTQLLGYTPQELTADRDRWRTIIFPEDIAIAEQSLRRLTAGETVEGELRAIAKDGRVMWLRFRHRPILDEQGRIVGVTGAVQDITQRKRAEQALIEADRKKDEFLATLAHELRNPLAPISNALELMRRAEQNPQICDQARNIMERQVRQLARLTDDLLDISRITQGKLQIRKEPIELAKAVQIAVEANRPLIDSFGHELSVSVPSDPIYLDADLTRIAQVFSNLLNNAAKYTEKRGRICLTVERRNNEAIVSVRDSGIGIAKEQLPHVFEMFSQSIPALERSRGGLGIGLSLVHRLVMAHCGHVEARSDGPGQGSEFIVHLPVRDAPVDSPFFEGNGEQPAKETKSRILLVDDNVDATEGLGMMLKLIGHEVSVTHDGIEAMEAAAACLPEVILLDIGLPKMNGYDVARRIRSEPWGKSMILIALTGWGQDEDKRRALEAGFDHHLAKPVQARDIQRLIESLVRVGPAKASDVQPLRAED